MCWRGRWLVLKKTRCLKFNGHTLEVKKKGIQEKDTRATSGRTPKHVLYLFLKRTRYFSYRFHKHVHATHASFT